MQRNRFNIHTEPAVRFLIQEYGITPVEKEFFYPLIGGYYDENISRELRFIQEQMRRP